MFKHNRDCLQGKVFLQKEIFNLNIKTRQRIAHLEDNFLFIYKLNNICTAIPYMKKVKNNKQDLFLNNFLEMKYKRTAFML